MKRRTLVLGGGAALIAGAGAVAVSFARMGNSADYDAAMAQCRAPLGVDANLRDVVRYAALAANGHNTQPWLFRLSDRTIHILPDLARRTPIVDPDDHHLYVSLGCAAENLALAAGASGRPGELRFDPLNGGTVIFDFSPSFAVASPLYEAIPHRQSTRADYDGRSVPHADLVQLQEAAKMPGVELVLITDRGQLNRLRDLVVAGNIAQMADPRFMEELKAWIRFNPRSAINSGDGLYSAASGNPSMPDWLGPHMFDLVFRPSSENDKYSRQLDSSAGAAIFVGAKADHEHWVRVGRACQRFALQATALGLKHAFVNQPVEVAELRSDLASLAGLPGRRPDLVMRFGYGPTLPKSPRRPVDAIII
jgi:nitroreductase